MTGHRVERIRTVTRKVAQKRCPWAAVILKIEGGYIAYESESDVSDDHRKMGSVPPIGLLSRDWKM